MLEASYTDQVMIDCVVLIHCIMALRKYEINDLIALPKILLTNFCNFQPICPYSKMKCTNHWYWVRWPMKIYRSRINAKIQHETQTWENLNTYTNACRSIKVYSRRKLALNWAVNPRANLHKLFLNTNTILLIKNWQGKRHKSSTKNIIRSRWFHGRRRKCGLIIVSIEHPQAEGMSDDLPLIEVHVVQHECKMTWSPHPAEYTQT